jgi:hypothetical protein
MALFEVDFGDSAHADAADADKMHALGADKHARDAFFQCSSGLGVEKRTRDRDL